MRVGAWLDRFRRQAGVPARPEEDLGPELISVFAALDDVEKQAAELRAETERLVADRIEQARREAERVLVDWRHRAAAERLRAESERRSELSAEARAIEAGGEAEAARVRAAGERRMASLVETVVAAIVEGRA